MSFILSGGGSHPQTKETIKWLHQKYRQLKILYMPQARESENNYNECVEWLKCEMANDNYSIELFSPQKTYSEQELKAFDMLYIGGGNIEKLLTFLHTSTAMSVIEHFNKCNKLIMGGSAGVIVLGANCKAYREYFVELPSYDGMNFFNGISFACHFKEDLILRELNKPYRCVLTKYVVHSPETIIAIPEEVSILVSNQMFTAIGGAFYIFTNGQMKLANKFCFIE